MQPESIADEAAHLVDLGPVELVTARLREAEAWLHAAELQARAADMRMQQARDAAAALVAAEVAGQELTNDEIVAAHDRARQLEAIGTHRATVYRARHEPVEKLKAELAEAKHEAWRPVFARGADYRIAAAAKLDRARLLAQVSESASDLQRAMAAAAANKATEAARPEWDRGNALLELATGNGHRWPRNPYVTLAGWGDRPTESAERRYWSKPLSAETSDAAA